MTQQTPRITFELSEKVLNIIIGGLGEVPYRVAAPVVEDLRAQYAKEPTSTTYTLTEQELDVVMGGLGYVPYQVAAPVIEELRAQFTKFVEDFNKPDAEPHNQTPSMGVLDETSQFAADVAAQVLDE